MEEEGAEGGDPATPWLDPAVAADLQDRRRDSSGCGGTKRRRRAGGGSAARVARRWTG
jgi:hypothetical protein